MNIAKPSEAELAALLSEHSHRHPEKARFTVPGDGGGDVVLPVLLGNPSGACKMPEGKPVSPSWDDTVAATFRPRPNVEAKVEQLVADCVLWPDQATWNSWVNRWAALPEIVQVAIRRKTGASMSMIEEPAVTSAKPEIVAAALSRNPSAVWRHATPPGEVLDLVINPPDAGVWRLFVSANKKTGAKHGQLARDMALSSLVLAVKSDGTALPASEILDRWCGLSLLVGLTVSHLAGITADYELGEW